MFRLEFLPAEHGDAIWIELGDAAEPRRILIDGGPASSYEQGLHKRLRQLPAGQRHIDLFVVTHIDSDHIDGALILLQEASKLGVSFGEIWFNGWHQIKSPEPGAFAPLQGEFLDAVLKQKLSGKRWNTQTKGAALVVPEHGPLPSWPIPEGARITLLSPGPQQLARLRARWDSALREFSPGDSQEALRRLAARRDYRPPETTAVFGEKSFGDDRSVANGSSIAFLVEHDGVSCVLAGDAHPRVLAASLRSLADSRNPGLGSPLRVDAFKLAHHGSMSNISEELLASVDCRRWIVSTNGAIFRHPDRPTAELVAAHSREMPEFLCNYDNDTTRRFAADAHKPLWHTRYAGEGVPAGPTGGIVVDLTRSATRKTPGGTRRPAAASGRRKKVT